MRVEIREQSFNPWSELEAYRKSPGLSSGGCGACASFVGTMRDFNQGEKVSKMTLQHYPGMTERQLLKFAGPLQRNLDLLDLLIIHRVGDVAPGDAIVLVAAWSAHRSAAFQGCRDMMEYLKSEAAFWKKETLSADGATRWVENISDGK